MEISTRLSRPSFSFFQSAFFVLSDFVLSENVLSDVEHKKKPSLVLSEGLSVLSELC